MNSLLTLLILVAAPLPADEAAQSAAVQPASASFKEGEAALKIAAAEMALSIGKPPPTVMKRYVLKKNWEFVRDPDGVLKGRAVEAVVFFKGGESGQCTRRQCTLTEQDQGGKWGKPGLDCIESLTMRVQCKSVEALKGGK